MRRIQNNIREKEDRLETRMRWEASYSRKLQGFRENDRNVIWYLEEEEKPALHLWQVSHISAITSRMQNNINPFAICGIRMKTPTT